MIIFSVEQATATIKENMTSICEAADLLGTNGPYASLEGAYKDQTELAFMTSQVELGKRLAKQFNQECHFERGHYGIWYLIDTQSDRIIDSFKTIKEVSERVAMANDSCTKVNGKYYIASKY